MNIKDKLQQLDRDFPSSTTGKKSVERNDLSEFISGKVVENNCGRCFRSVKHYPGAEIYGRPLLDLLKNINPVAFGMAGKDEKLKNADLKNAVFIDTETTGLAGGTGTVPFLIGMGFFRENSFCVEQYMMRDYHEEHALLEFVQKKLEKAEVIVSYNGKGYDLNILSARFILSRMQNPAPNIPHLDLLYTARRLWRKRLSDCSLVNIERCILDFYRADDIPGFMIPGIFFEYLRTGNGEILKPVFKHNRLDIITLACLAVYTGQIYQDPSEYLEHAEDFISIARAFEDLEKYETAVNYYQKGLKLGVSKEIKRDVLYKLGYIFKRRTDWDKAVKIWEFILKHFPNSFGAYEELAKYFEHRIGDFSKGIEIVKRALNQIEIMEKLKIKNFTESRNEFEHRLKRLKRRETNREKEG